MHSAAIGAFFAKSKMNDNEEGTDRENAVAVAAASGGSMVVAGAAGTGAGSLLASETTAAILGMTAVPTVGVAAGAGERLERGKSFSHV